MPKSIGFFIIFDHFWWILTNFWWNWNVYKYNRNDFKKSPKIVHISSDFFTKIRICTTNVDHNCWLNEQKKLIKLVPGRLVHDWSLKQVGVDSGLVLDGPAPDDRVVVRRRFPGFEISAPSGKSHSRKVEPLWWASTLNFFAVSDGTKRIRWEEGLKPNQPLRHLVVILARKWLLES